jgi:hypothetical protein
MPQLQRLGLINVENLGVDGVRALQPGLHATRTALKQLSLAGCSLRLIADALVGNTTMESLNIEGSRVFCNALDDITCMSDLTRLDSERL